MIGEGEEGPVVSKRRFWSYLATDRIEERVLLTRSSSKL